ncbi:MAG: hypothetical protein U9P79_09180 [Candidatus Cloacimonadota bacterium]|nr:hypothetical protein [Candidatus Cloacimonadota bacterium]
MFKKKECFPMLLHSENGFGLMQVIFVLLVITISFGSFFIGSYYARKLATEHYHSRVALLAASGKINLIKFYNYQNLNGETVINGIPSLYDGVVIDAQALPVIEATVNVTKSTHTDMIVAPYVIFDQVEVKLTWQEPSRSLLNSSLFYTKSLTLREDYFRRQDVIN